MLYKCNTLCSYFKKMLPICVHVPCPTHSQDGQTGRGTPNRSSSVKGRPDFALGCRLRCIINRVICTSPPSALAFFFHLFFLFFVVSPLNAPRSTAVSFYYCPAPSASPIKKKVPRVSSKPPRRSPSLKLLQLRVRKYSSANPPIPSLTSSFRLNPAPSHLTIPTPSLLTVCHGRFDDGN